MVTCLICFCKGCMLCLWTTSDFFLEYLGLWCCAPQTLECTFQPSSSNQLCPHSDSHERIIPSHALAPTRAPCTHQLVHHMHPNSPHVRRTPIALLAILTCCVSSIQFAASHAICIMHPPFSSRRRVPYTSPHSLFSCMHACMPSQMHRIPGTQDGPYTNSTPYVPSPVLFRPRQPVSFIYCSSVVVL